MQDIDLSKIPKSTKKPSAAPGAKPAKPTAAPATGPSATDRPLPPEGSMACSDAAYQQLTAFSKEKPELIAAQISNEKDANKKVQWFIGSTCNENFKVNPTKQLEVINELANKSPAQVQQLAIELSKQKITPALEPQVQYGLIKHLDMEAKAYVMQGLPETARSVIMNSLKADGFDVAKQLELDNKIRDYSLKDKFEKKDTGPKLSEKMEITFSLGGLEELSEAHRNLVKYRRNLDDEKILLSNAQQMTKILGDRLISEVESYLKDSPKVPPELKGKKIGDVTIDLSNSYVIRSFPPVDPNRPGGPKTIKYGEAHLVFQVKH